MTNPFSLEKANAESLDAHRARIEDLVKAPGGLLETMPLGSLWTPNALFDVPELEQGKFVMVLSHEFDEAKAGSCLYDYNLTKLVIDMNIPYLRFYTTTFLTRHEKTFQFWWCEDELDRKLWTEWFVRAM